MTFESVENLLKKNDLRGLTLLETLSFKQKRMIQSKFAILCSNGLYIPLDCSADESGRLVYKGRYFSSDENAPQTLSPIEIERKKNKLIMKSSSGAPVLLPIEHSLLLPVRIIPQSTSFFNVLETQSHGKTQLRNIIEKTEHLREAQDQLRRLEMRRGRSGPDEDVRMHSLKSSIEKMQQGLNSYLTSSCEVSREFENFMKKSDHPVHFLTLKTRFCTKMFEQDSSKIICLLPGWYIHVDNIQPSNFYHHIDYVCKFYPTAWLRVAGAKNIVGSAVSSWRTEDESQMLQNLPAWQHIRIKLIDSWLGRKDISEKSGYAQALCKYMGIIHSNEQLLCKLFT